MEGDGGPLGTGSGRVSGDPPSRFCALEFWGNRVGFDRRAEKQHVHIAKHEDTNGAGGMGAASLLSSLRG